MQNVTPCFSRLQRRLHPPAGGLFLDQIIGLRQPLPVLSIPLRPTDADVALELQPLIDQCHERGRYHRLRYRAELDPPFNTDDAAWVDQLLRQHQLR